MNIERKRLLKQRRERTLLNAKGKGLAEEYFLTALKASHKSYKPQRIYIRQRKIIMGRSMMKIQISQ